MKNNFWFILACVLMFFIGYSVNDSAVSFQKYKVAVVDVESIMQKSPEILALKESQNKQSEEINTLITKAQNEIANQTDRNKALQLEAAYRKQIEEKKNAMDEEYNKKIVEITKNIRNLISKQAKESNYNLVLPTGMVISGGEDITESIAKDIK